MFSLYSRDSYIEAIKRFDPDAMSLYLKSPQAQTESGDINFLIDEYNERKEKQGSSDQDEERAHTDSESRSLASESADFDIQNVLTCLRHLCDVENGQPDNVEVMRFLQYVTKDYTIDTDFYVDLCLAVPDLFTCEFLELFFANDKERSDFTKKFLEHDDFNEGYANLLDKLLLGAYNIYDYASISKSIKNKHFLIILQCCLQISNNFLLEKVEYPDSLFHQLFKSLEDKVVLSQLIIQLFIANGESEPGNPGKKTKAELVKVINDFLNDEDPANINKLPILLSHDLGAVLIEDDEINGFVDDGFTRIIKLIEDYNAYLNLNIPSKEANAEFQKKITKGKQFAKTMALLIRHDYYLQSELLVDLQQIVLNYKRTAPAPALQATVDWFSQLSMLAASLYSLNQFHLEHHNTDFVKKFINLAAWDNPIDLDAVFIKRRNQMATLFEPIITQMVQFDLKATPKRFATFVTFPKLARSKFEKSSYPEFYLKTAVDTELQMEFSQVLSRYLMVPYYFLDQIMHLAHYLGLPYDFTIRHRSFSGPSKAIWDAASVNEKFVVLLVQQSHLSVISLPLAKSFDLVRAALFSSYLYHFKRENDQSQACQELEKLLKRTLKMSMYAKTTILELAKAAQPSIVNVKDDFTVECPSEDDDSEQETQFQALPSQYRHALEMHATLIMDRAQVNKIWKGPAAFKQLSESSTGGRAAYYSIIRRAKIHHPIDRISQVSADLSKLNYFYNQNNLTNATVATISTRFMIANFRGIHYDQGRWSQAARRFDRKNTAQLPVFAEAVYKKAQIPLHAPELTPQQINQLTTIAIFMRHQVAALAWTGPVRGSDGHVYPNGVAAIQCLYTTNYRVHKSKCQEVTKLLTDQKNLPSSLNVMLSFVVGPENNHISASDTPYHAIKYGADTKGYSTQGNRLEPQWRANGQVLRPFVGKVHTYLYSIQDYLALLPRHVPSMVFSSQFHVTTSILPERETTVTGMIPAEFVAQTTVIQYPNFKSEDYKKSYQARYGLTVELYQQFRHRIMNSKPGSEQRNEVGIYLTEHLASFHDASLIEQARHLAQQKGAYLVYRDNTGQFTLETPESNPPTTGPRALAGSAESKLKKAKRDQRDKPNSIGLFEKIVQSHLFLPLHDPVNYIMAKSGIQSRACLESTTTNSLPSSRPSWKPNAFKQMPKLVEDFFLKILLDLEKVTTAHCFCVIIKSFLLTADLTIGTQNGANNHELYYMGGDRFFLLQAKPQISAKPKSAKKARLK